MLVLVLFSHSSHQVSCNCQKGAHTLVIKSSTLHPDKNGFINVNDCNIESLVSGLSKAIDDLRKAVDILLFNRAIEHFCVCVSG